MLPPQGAAVDAINSTIALTEAERIDRLRLIRSDQVGPRGIMAQTPTHRSRESASADLPFTSLVKIAMAASPGRGRHEDAGPRFQCQGHLSQAPRRGQSMVQARHSI
jgi:hypothetical protein